jgi:23S rRNA (uridine2552-2'-O)-methyltransferase
MSKFILRDKYFHKAKQDGYRARSAFKLKEIQAKFNAVKKGDKTLDLGCAPGSFLQVLSEIAGPDGTVVGIDILPVKPMLQKNVMLLQQDIRETDIAGLCSRVAPGGFNVITCDISPNLSGIREVDDRNISDLYEAVRRIVAIGLKTGGHFILKTFYSDNFKDIKLDLTRTFKTVSVFKPVASRNISSETYLVGLGKKS